ncbi:PREDICTED: transmembrane protein 72-like isoform X1 [Branchiostoma belcheri]|uniref:Transmembrane protein 72-like isoform X1 n=1 Tax=Branchiostoma belcheri TaxID=7741 RepID=A0A6P4ZUC1_BRABE|nr:PREDICTED: transmembrane protein 72-like isoform X1 [Branchiostoma belcheri]
MVQCTWMWTYYTLVTRIFGILTAIVLWGVGVETITSINIGIGLYLIIVAIVTSFLEATFLLDKCACCGEGTACHKVWRVVMWIDNWKKAILYILLSIVCFLNPVSSWMAVIPGLFLILSGLLYMGRTYKKHRDEQTRESAQGEAYSRWEGFEDPAEFTPGSPADEIGSAQISTELPSEDKYDEELEADGDIDATDETAPAIPNRQ